jgi:hypothetical protein
LCEQHDDAEVQVIAMDSLNTPDFATAVASAFRDVFAVRPS